MQSRYTEAQARFMESCVVSALARTYSMEPLDLMIQLSRRRRECTPSIPFETIQAYVTEKIDNGTLVPADDGKYRLSIQA